MNNDTINYENLKENEETGDLFRTTYSSDPDLKASLATMERRNVQFDNSDPYKRQDNGLKTPELVSHSGFENLADLDEYIKELEVEVEKFKIRWIGTQTQQGLNERLEELALKIEQKSRIYANFPEGMIEPEYEAIQNEYSSLLELQNKELEMVKEKSSKIAKLLEVRKRWILNSRDRFKTPIKGHANISEQLTAAEAELKRLYAEVYTGKDSQFIKDRIDVLKNEIIDYLGNEEKNYHNSLGFDRR